MNIIFASGGEFGFNTLHAVHQSNHSIQAIITAPDRRSGRGLKQTKNPLKEFAIQHHIALFQPTDAASLQKFVLSQNNTQCMIVISYGMMIPTPVLAHFKHGCINAHASLLPRWRGASPIEHSILHGEKKSGITWIQMNSKLDQGDILLQHSLPIETNATAIKLRHTLSKMAAHQIAPLLDQIESNTIQSTPQNNALATYAPKLTKNDGKIDWHQSAQFIERKIKAMQPWPKSFTFYKKKRIIIHSATHKTQNSKPDIPPGTVCDVSKNNLCIQCINGIICPNILQIEGKCTQTIADFLKGHSITKNDQFV